MCAHWMLSSAYGGKRWWLKPRQTRTCGMLRYAHTYVLKCTLPSEQRLQRAWGRQANGASGTTAGRQAHGSWYSRWAGAVPLLSVVYDIRQLNTNARQPYSCSTAGERELSVSAAEQGGAGRRPPRALMCPTDWWVLAGPQPHGWTALHAASFSKGHHQSWYRMP